MLEIATGLDEESDPVLIKKCADYFIANEQFDKAVDLLAVGKKVKNTICTFCLHLILLWCNEKKIEHTLLVPNIKFNTK